MKVLLPVLAATWLALIVPASAQAPLPPVVERYEQLLVRSPGKGTAFDKVYQHFFEGEGLEKLAARWQVKADADGADAATYWLLLGVLADRQGKTPEAIKLFQKATELKPADARGWTALGETQASAGNLPAAVAALQKALANNPTKDTRPQLFRQLARSQQRAFDGEGALKTWQLFVNESPDDPFVIEEAADAMAEAEKFVEAKALYEKLRDLAGTDPYKRVTAIMKLAQLEEKQGRREPARALYESALPLASPASWMHREVRARIEEGYRRQDDLPGLVTYYEEWLKKQTQDVDVALRLSDALLELNRKKDAVEWLRKASEWAPDRKEVLVALAKRLGEIEQPQEAVAILQKLTQAHPEEDSYREFLGDAQWQVFKKTKDESAKKLAIESWRSLAPAATKDTSKVSRVADLLRGKDLTDEALEFSARAVAMSPDVPELRQRWAEYLFDLKREADAWKVLADMVAGDRATAPNFLRLARLQQRRHELDAALDSAAKGLALAPTDFELMMLQWRLFSEANQWAEAAGLFERLLAAAPSVYSVDQVEDQQVQALRSLEKLDEVSKQLSGRIGKEPPLTEPDLRLLLRITLQNGDLDTTAEALAEAKQRFPDSAALIRRQVEYEKRKGNLPGRVAALQRLVELQPKQKVEWLREIVRAYQEDGLWDQALAAAQRVVEEAPANPDSFVLVADLNFAAQRFDAGVAKLREAIKLSDKPNDLRLRLARTYLEAGRGDEARLTYDAVFEAESDPKTRLSLTRQLAEVYLQQGKLDELISRFRQRQRAEEGGWRYALYLAEIFQQMQDFAAAREELTKSLGARSRDGSFVRQLMRLSENEGNTVECARFARMLAEVEPSEEHQIDLADSLLDNGEPDEAIKVLRANQEGFLKNPIAWREVLLKFHSKGAGAALSEVIQKSLEDRSDDWRSRLILAEIQIGMGNVPAAQRWLWGIFSLPPDPPAPPVAASPNNASGGLMVSYGSLMFGGMSGTQSKLERRLTRSYEYRQNLAQILASLSGNNRFGRSRFNYSFGSPFGGNVARPTMNTVDEARDVALIYLASLAERQDQAESFLSELEKRLLTADRKERMTVFGMVQAREPLRKEILAEMAQPSGDPEIDTYCFQLSLTELQREGRTRPIDPQELAQVETFLRRQKGARQEIMAESGYYNVLMQAGKTEEAKKMADEVLADAETADARVLPFVFGFAVQREAYDVAERMLDRMMAASQQAGQVGFKQQLSWYRFSLASGLLKKKETVPRAVALLGQTLTESYGNRLPGSMASLSSFARRSYRSSWREGQQFPYANRYFDDQKIQQWRQVFDQIKGADALDELKKELNRQIQSLPEDQTVYAQLVRACFWWWNDEKGDAIREVSQLARELKDDDLKMMSSTMFSDIGQPADALKILGEMTATTGDLAIDKQVRMLNLARAANDLDQAKVIATALAKQRLDQNDQSQLINVLRELNLKELSDQLSKQRSTRPAPGQRNRIEDQLNAQVNANNSTESIALARAILARDPIASMRQGEDYQRRQALEALKKFKMIDTYRTELDKQLAETPSSVRTVYLLAEAYTNEKDEKALEYYRKLAELKPNDTSFQLRLANILRNKKQPEEAMKIWEAVLVRDPDPVFQSDFSEVIQTFRESKQLSRLGAALLKMPKSKSSAMTAMYGGGQDYSNYLGQVATELQRDNKPAEAIQVWRAAIAQSTDMRSGNEINVVAPLVSALLEAGDTAGATTELQQFFFPEKKARPLFGFEYFGQSMGWMQISTSGNGRMEMAVVGLLRLARQAGALELLRAKALKAVTGDSDPDEQLVLLIDSQQRDPAALEDFGKRLRAAVQKSVEQKNQSAGQVYYCIAQDLREWPEAQRLALDVMLSALKAMNQQPNDYYQVLLRPQVAELATQLSENDTARTILKEWQTAMQQQLSSNRYGYDFRQQMKTLEMMARLGLTDETKALIKTLKGGQQMRNDTSAKQGLEDFENRLKVLADGGGSARIVVWTAPPVTKEAPTTVYWEIGAAFKSRNNDSRSRYLSVAGEDLPVLDGRYDIELFYGSTPTAMKKIATVPAAKSRGIWSSPAPLGPGYVLAVAREKSKVLFSAPATVLAEPNRLVNPQLGTSKVEANIQPGTAPRLTVDGWNGVSASLLTPRTGGPRIGGQYVSLRQLGRMNGGDIQITQKLSLEAGRSYLFSGWVRFATNEGSTQIRGRFLDKDGKPVGDLYSNYVEGDRWTQIQRWLVRSRESDGSVQVIPEKATEIEVTIQTSSSGDLDGLYFGEVPSEAGENAEQ